MTSKQRAKLRSMANTMDPILFVGKDGVTDGTGKEAYDALEARDLIKCVVQQNCEQCIGRRFVMYRESRKNKQISLD